MTTRTSRILLIAGSLVLCALLFFAPRTLQGNSPSPKTETASAGIEAMQFYARMAVKTLAGADASRLERFTKEEQADSLIHFWLEKRRPDLAALSAEEKALRSGTAEDFFAAGNRYYTAVRFNRDESATPALFQSAIRNFSNGLKKDPGNVDAKIMLASCYVEGSADPMKGITLLKEVEKTDSNNVKLQLSFAFFSVTSGQLDKAEQRFRKALKADSTYIEVYLHLADLYERQGDIAAAIEALTAYATRTGDITARVEANKYIQQLKKQTTIN